MRWKAGLVYATCCLLWGSTWAAIKFGLETLPPFLFGGVRMLLASALLVPVVLWQRRRLPGEATPRAPIPWGNVAFIGFLQLGVSYALIFFAQQHLASGFAAVLFSSYPIWAALFAHALLPDEPMSWRKGAAAALGLLGIAVLEWPALVALGSGGAWHVAALLPVGAAAISAFANVRQKRSLGHVPAALNLCAQTFVGAVVLLSLHLAFERGAPAQFTVTAWASVVYLAGFGTVITFLCLFWLLPRVPMVAIGVIPLVDTTIAVTLGALFLGEGLGWRLVAGGLLVLTGATAANAPTGRTEAPRTEPAP